MLSVIFWLQRLCEYTYGQVLCITVVDVLLKMTGSDILDLRDALQAGCIIALTALASRELINAANLSAAGALKLNLLIKLRHECGVGVVVLRRCGVWVVDGRWKARVDD